MEAVVELDDRVPNADRVPRGGGGHWHRHDLDKARTKPAEWEKGKGRSVVVLRAHKDCSYKQVDDVMNVCRKVGYNNIQLRAIKANPRT